MSRRGGRAGRSSIKCKFWNPNDSESCRYGARCSFLHGEGGRPEHPAGPSNDAPIRVSGSSASAESERNAAAIRSDRSSSPQKSQHIFDNIGSMDDFIEFPELILPALDGGAQPDLKILLDDGKSVNEVCSVHLRAMGMPSDFFYMLAITGDSSEVQRDPPNKPTSDSPRSGDSAPCSKASNVELPQPLRPTMPTFSPRRMEMLAAAMRASGPRRSHRSRR